MRCSYQNCSVRIFSTEGENPNEGGFLVLEHDGGEDGGGEGDHGKVAADLLVVPHLQQSVKVVLGIVQKDDIFASQWERVTTYVKYKKKKLTTPTTAIASTSTLAALGKAPTFTGSKLQLN